MGGNKETVAHWRGRVDEKLKFIKETLDTMNEKLTVVQSHEVEISSLSSTAKRHDGWISDHELEHKEAKKAEQEQEHHSEEISMKRLGAYVTGLSILISAVVQFILGCVGF